MSYSFYSFSFFFIRGACSIVPQFKANCSCCCYCSVFFFFFLCIIDGRAGASIELGFSSFLFLIGAEASVAGCSTTVKARKQLLSLAYSRMYCMHRTFAIDFGVCWWCWRERIFRGFRRQEQMKFLSVRSVRFV